MISIKKILTGILASGICYAGALQAQDTTEISPSNVKVATDATVSPASKRPSGRLGMASLNGKTPEELGLNAEQIQNIKKLRDEQMTKSRSISESLRLKREELRTELQKTDPNRQVAEKIAQEVNKFQGELLNQRIEFTFAIKGIMTPEQFTKYQSALSERLEKHRARMAERRKMEKEVLNETKETLSPSPSVGTPSPASVRAAPAASAEKTENTSK